MTTATWVLATGGLVVAILATEPRNAAAQAVGEISATRALLGTPGGSIQLKSAATWDDTAANTAAERALLGNSGGIKLALEPDKRSSRRSAGEAALLGR